MTTAAPSLQDTPTEAVRCAPSSNEPPGMQPSTLPMGGQICDHPVCESPDSSCPPRVRLCPLEFRVSCPPIRNRRLSDRRSCGKLQQFGTEPKFSVHRIGSVVFDRACRDDPSDDKPSDDKPSDDKPTDDDACDHDPCDSSRHRVDDGFDDGNSRTDDRPEQSAAAAAAAGQLGDLQREQ